MSTSALLRVVISVSAFSLIATGCTISDSDRCADGYYYLPKPKICCLDDFVRSTDEMSCDAPVPVDTTPVNTDTGDMGTTDSQATASDDAPPSGLGESCATDTAVCADFEANYCVVNPLDTSAAYCSVEGCAKGTCETGYVCCDCQASALLPKKVACLKNADAAQVNNATVGCSCP